jgi:hypothetical protein
MMNSFDLPNLYLVQQDIPTPRLENVTATLMEKLEAFPLANKVQKGDRIAITAGSRGIRDMAQVLRGLALHFRRLGAKPFISPAMGSHGGATAEGQVEVLSHLGVDEKTVEAPIVSSMEVVEVGRLRGDVPVLVGKDFKEADHIVVVNRIKSHTDFKGEIESGLLKIMMIGMGKHKGAQLAHKAVIHRGFQEVVVEWGNTLLKNLPILMGVGIVENYYSETAYLEVIGPTQFVTEEKRLLKEAKKIIGKIPFNGIDLLIIDEMGKNISGTGMDTNVIGRIMHIATPEPKPSQFRRIFVRDINEETGGNAIGIGLADFTTERLVSKINREVTRINCVTGTTPEKGRIPIAYSNDEEAIVNGLHNAGVFDFKTARLIWVRNTLELKFLKISEALLPETKRERGLKTASGPFQFSFDNEGNLPWGDFPSVT